MDRGSCTLVHSAARNGWLTIVEQLTNGASIEDMDGNKNTSLHLAVQSGHTRVVQLLLRNGASTEVTNVYNYTPLHHAAKGGHTGIVELYTSKKGCLS